MQDLYQAAIEHHQAGRLDDAIAIYKKILIEHGQHPQVLYLLGVALYTGNALEDAENALSLAHMMQPSHLPTLCCLAHTLRKQHKHESAIGHYRRILETPPPMGEAQEGLALSLALHAENIATLDINQAKALTAEAYQIASKDVTILQACGYVAFVDEDYEKAEAFYREQLEIAPENADVHFNLGKIFFIQKKFQWAAGAFQSALERNPTLSQSHLFIGKSAVYNSQWALAREHLEKYKNSGQPLKADWHYFYGETLRHLDEKRQAIIHLQKAILENPEYAEAYSTLGHIFRSQKRLDQSLECLHKALEIKPQLFEALFGLSMTYREYTSKNKSEHMQKALDYGLKAYEIRDDAGSEFNLANVYMAFGLPQQSIVHYKQALAKDVENPGSESSCCFNCNYLEEISAQDLFEQHKRWGERFITPYDAHRFPHHNTPDPHKRIRIGFLSPDFCIHPVAYFFRPVFEAFDRDKLEIFLFYNNYADKPLDQFSLKFKELADHWLEIQGKSHKETAECIHEHNIDILIDLAGHSCGHKLFPMAFKPAPVQCTWLGYPNTTGSHAIDYRIVDPITDPPESQSISTEKLLHLPKGFNCYRPPYKFPEPQPAPALKNGYVTFGSFNNTCKHTPRLLRLWGRMIQAVPNARIALKDKFLAIEKTKKFVIDNLCAGGLDPERIIFIDFTHTNLEHLEKYSQIDIALDPHPYNGTTTSCEALMMSVPILTKLGDRHTSRVTASLLHRLNMDDWIARDDDHLIELAQEKASDIQALANTRTYIKENVLNSPICDNQGFAQDFEVAMRKIWTQWCNEQSTQTLA